MAPLIRPVRFARFSLAMLVSVAGCDASAGSASGLVAEIDTVGDTIVVRTISGSIRDSIATLVPVFQIGELEGRDEYLFGNVQGLAVDSAGALYLSDAQVPSVREYGPDGRYIMTSAVRAADPANTARAQMLSPSCAMAASYCAIRPAAARGCAAHRARSRTGRRRSRRKANAQDVATDMMRNDDPDWNWTSPSIPDTKPHFLSLLVSQEGHIWVRVSQPGVRIPDDAIVEPDPRPDGRRHAVRRWREPIAFDVFEPDGSYVGRVLAPVGFTMQPKPVIRGDTVWAIVRDELDLQRLARFRVEAESRDTLR